MEAISRLAPHSLTVLAPRLPPPLLMEKPGQTRSISGAPPPSPPPSPPPPSPLPSPPPSPPSSIRPKTGSHLEQLPPTPVVEAQRSKQTHRRMFHHQGYRGNRTRGFSQTLPNFVNVTAYPTA
ncbi:hypothetical protein NHX12_006058 [Muraenolepis orangiensis]|uniref:Uncharacterized protein n=1 Tax=Muraenolepis orangiensis TaxID=630683 RepID=A0A9Q0ICI5_9TELE|nr:hypothetical protein NHX12_006058 [Muraenolepis orangiensis]